MNEYGEIWVFAELNDGKASDVTFELLGEARRLSADGKASVFTAGTQKMVEDAADEIFSYGADRIYASCSPLLEQYTVEGYAAALAELIREYRPEIVLFGATMTGRDLAPKLASKVHTGLTADCTRLDISTEEYLEYLQKETTADVSSIDAARCEGLLKATKPAFGGNLLATIYCPEARPQMASVRPGVFDKKQIEENGNGEIIWLESEVSGEDIHVNIRELVKETKQGTVLADADVIVAGGRGLMDEEGFELLKEFAEKIGAEVGVSRSLVDNGWADVSMQIGQSGITVAPKLYMNFGISGVIQHTAGILGSEVIVSVNNDPDAPIFEVSDYCIVGDAKTALREFIKQWDA